MYPSLGTGRRPGIPAASSSVLVALCGPGGLGGGIALPPSISRLNETSRSISNIYRDGILMELARVAPIVGSSISQTANQVCCNNFIKEGSL